MAALLAIFHQRRALRRERVFRDRTQVLDTDSDTDLISRYRFDRTTIWEIINSIKYDIKMPTERGGHVIPPHIQVLVTLRFLAKGNFLSETADLHGISKTSASRIIPRVCSSLVKHYPIRFPTDQQTVKKNKYNFYQMAGFPNVIGCIDGVLIPIQTPYEDESSYVCRKGFHAINVQAVADPDMRFINVVVKWPGSTHDSFILSNSNIADDLSRQQRGILLGDSGYPLKTWLMTPYLQPSESAHRKYNVAHAKTRNTVERSFGILKARFRCLDRSGGQLCYQPRKAVTIIASCFSLHNIAMKKRMPLPDCSNIVPDHDNSVYVHQLSGRAQEMRNTISRSF